MTREILAVSPRFVAPGTTPKLVIAGFAGQSDAIENIQAAELAAALMPVIDNQLVVIVELDQLGLAVQPVPFVDTVAIAFVEQALVLEFVGPTVVLEFVTRIAGIEFWGRNAAIAFVARTVALAFVEQVSFGLVIVGVGRSDPLGCKLVETAGGLGFQVVAIPAGTPQEPIAGNRRAAELLAGNHRSLTADKQSLAGLVA